MIYNVTIATMIFSHMKITVTLFGWQDMQKIQIVWFQKISIPPPPHGGSRNFLGVGGSKRDKFLKGRGVHKEFFFPEGLKCDRMNTYVFFQLIRGSQEKPKVLSVEIDVGFLVIYFLLLSRRQMTRTAPRHTSEHVRRRVKQNGWLEKYRSQSLTLAVLSECAEMSSSGSG